MRLAGVRSKGQAGITQEPDPICPCIVDLRERKGWKMIQDIKPHILNNQYRPSPPQQDSFLLCYKGKQAFVKVGEDGQISYPSFWEAEKVLDSGTLYQNYQYLFSVDGVGFYLGSGLDYGKIPGYGMEDIQIFRRGTPKHLAFAGVTGWQLSRWYQDRKFCGRCGRLMVHDEKERMMRCPECGNMEFPKICPAVIIAVTNGNQILLSKYAGREYKKYALLAGFNEAGETIEETVHREVMEEVGLKVKNLRYYKSQPWPFSDTLLMGFFCELDGEDEIRIDQEELSLAGWFGRDALPVENDGASLTREMMDVFRKGLVDLRR